jgi:hypothetical protein
MLCFVIPLLLASGNIFSRDFGALPKFSSFSPAVSSRTVSSLEPEYIFLFGQFLK